MKQFKRSKTLSLPPNIGMVLATKRNVFQKDINLHYLMFLWSVHVLSKRTTKVLHDHIGTSTGAMSILENP
jgi:hypothetical protein